MANGDPPIDWGISPGATEPRVIDPSEEPTDWGDSTDVSDPELVPAELQQPPVWMPRNKRW